MGVHNFTSPHPPPEFVGAKTSGSNRVKKTWDDAECDLPGKNRSLLFIVTIAFVTTVGFFIR